MDLDDYYIRIKNFDIDKALVRVLMKLEKDIIALNVSQHRSEGVLSTGKSISSVHPYAAITVFLKQNKGTLTNGNPSIINLHEDGSFHGLMKIIWGTTEHELISDDDKTNDLINKYGADIFGLTRESLDRLIPKIKNLLELELRNV